jgi:L-ribulose-5-phosphate 3-epimerase
MQGRLSPIVDGQIQSFPWQFWKDEFPLSEKYGFGMLEWTLDQERLYENPLLTSEGQKEIKFLCNRHGIKIPSLTGDCFMQAPFWKATVGQQQKILESDFIAVLNACNAVGIKYIVVPLVDGGRLESKEEEDKLIRFMHSKRNILASCQLEIIFESDFGPEELARFISRLDPALFGINYDIGNSAALGYKPKEEFSAYGKYIRNVHVKDRLLGGTTVPLGTGSADFEGVFKELGRIKYQGNFILQTARAVDHDHASTLVRYREMTARWMTQFGLAL